MNASENRTTSLSSLNQRSQDFPQMLRLRRKSWLFLLTPTWNQNSHLKAPGKGKVRVDPKKPPQIVEAHSRRILTHSWLLMTLIFSIACKSVLPFSIANSSFELLSFKQSSAYNFQLSCLKRLCSKSSRRSCSLALLGQ